MLRHTHRLLGALKPHESTFKQNTVFIVPIAEKSPEKPPKVEKNQIHWQFGTLPADNSEQMQVVELKELLCKRRME